MQSYLVTGGAGFIGSNFIRHVLDARPGHRVINLDALTYAGSQATLHDLMSHADHVFVEGDIRDRELVASLLREHKPTAIIHFAAQTHVDRSIVYPESLVHTNILGTFKLLAEACAYWEGLGPSRNLPSASCMSPRMRCMDHWAMKGTSPRFRGMLPIPPTRHPRPLRIIWCEHITGPTACPPW